MAVATPDGNAVRPRRFRLPRMPLADAVAETTADRDRFLDAIRAFALLVVAAGHFVMGIVWWDADGVPRVSNLLAVFSGGPLLTWAFQVLPLFFLAGGAVNAASWESRGERLGYPRWVWARAARLLKPVVVYLAAACALALVVTAAVDAAVAAPLMLLLTQLLWFIGVYLAVTALTPWLWRAHRRAPVGSLVALVAAVALIDLAQVRLPGGAVVGLAAFVAGWAVPHQLGFWYRTWVPAQQLARVLAVGASVIVAALLANTVLTAFLRWYPASMVGMPGEPRSNLVPPSLVLVLHSLVIGWAAIMVAPWVRRLASNSRIWRPVVAINLGAMTLYLWHLPVLTGLLTLTHLLGLDRPVQPRGELLVPTGWGYLAGSLVLAVVYAVLVWLVVRSLWWTEHLPLPRWDRPWTSGGSPSAAPRAPDSAAATAGAVGSVMLAGTGFLMLSGIGLGGFPLRTTWFAGIVPLNAAAALLLIATATAVLRAIAARSS